LFYKNIFCKSNFITNFKNILYMKYLYIILITIISVQMSAQTVGVVGQEYLPNPGVCTTQSTADGCDTTGVDGSGTINQNGNGEFYGTSAASGAAYGSVLNSSGDPISGNHPAHYGNRIYKLFKKGNAVDPQFVALDVTVPAGNYTYSIYTRWPAAVDYDAAPAKKPFLRIKGHGNNDDADNASLVDVVPNYSTGNTLDDWIQTTGQVVIPAASDGSDLKIRFSVGKLGGSNASPTNLAEIMLIDNVSLKFDSSLSVADNKISDIQVFPNPAEQFIMFNGIDDKSNVDLFNISGKHVKSLIVNSIDSKIDVSDLTNGVYLARINKIKTSIFVKK
jgi:hypothetical protein